MGVFMTSLQTASVLLNVWETYKSLKMPVAGLRGQRTVKAMAQRKRGLKSCLAVWLVWACICILERPLDSTVGMIMPFYAQVKGAALLLLLLFRAHCAEPILLHVIRPFIKPHIKTVDSILHLLGLIGSLLFGLLATPWQFIRAFRAWESLSDGDDPGSNPPSENGTPNGVNPRQPADRVQLQNLDMNHDQLRQVHRKARAVFEEIEEAQRNVRSRMHSASSSRTRRQNVEYEARNASHQSLRKPSAEDRRAGAADQQPGVQQAAYEVWHPPPQAYADELRSSEVPLYPQLQPRRSSPPPYEALSFAADGTGPFAPNGHSLQAGEAAQSNHVPPTPVLPGALPLYMPTPVPFPHALLEADEPPDASPPPSKLFPPATPLLPGALPLHMPAPVPFPHALLEAEEPPSPPAERPSSSSPGRDKALPAPPADAMDVDGTASRRTRTRAKAPPTTRKRSLSPAARELDEAELSDGSSVKRRRVGSRADKTAKAKMVADLEKRPAAAPRGSSGKSQPAPVDAPKQEPPRPPSRLEGLRPPSRQPESSRPAGASRHASGASATSDPARPAPTSRHASGTSAAADPPRSPPRLDAPRPPSRQAEPTRAPSRAEQNRPPSRSIEPSRQSPRQTESSRASSRPLEPSRHSSRQSAKEAMPPPPPLPAAPTTRTRTRMQTRAAAEEAPAGGPQEPATATTRGRKGKGR